MSEYVLVPVEPTKEMRKAGRGPWATNDPEEAARAAYKSMLAVRPAESIKKVDPVDELHKLEQVLAVWFADEILENLQINGILTSKTEWSDLSDHTSRMKVRSLRYLELLGRLERHPDNNTLMRVKG